MPIVQSTADQLPPLHHVRTVEGVAKQSDPWSMYQMQGIGISVREASAERNKSVIINLENQLEHGDGMRWRALGWLRVNTSVADDENPSNTELLSWTQNAQGGVGGSAALRTQRKDRWWLAPGGIAQKTVNRHELGNGQAKWINKKRKKKKRKKKMWQRRSFKQKGRRFKP